MVEPAGPRLAVAAGVAELAGRLRLRAPAALCVLLLALPRAALAASMARAAAGRCGISPGTGSAGSIVCEDVLNHLARALWMF